jgi:hypothetical protein
MALGLTERIANMQKKHGPPSDRAESVFLDAPSPH